MYVFTNPEGLDVDPLDFDPHALGFARIKAPGHPAANRFRLSPHGLADDVIPLNRVMSEIGG